MITPEIMERHCNETCAKVRKVHKYGWVKSKINYHCPTIWKIPSSVDCQNCMQIVCSGLKASCTRKRTCNSKPRNEDRNTSLTNTEKYNAKLMSRFMKKTQQLYGTENIRRYSPETIPKWAGQTLFLELKYWEKNYKE